ncbi:MAG: DUF2314 domain-containing protein [Caulobacteraceae bacterium]
MRRLLAFAAAGALFVAPAARAQVAQMPPDQLAALNKDFADAVQAARASLPVFWERLAENPGTPPADTGLKVAFRTPQGGAEEVWLQDIKRDGARIVGRLNYDPENLPNMHRTNIVPVREADIIDWSFKEGRKRYGEFTTRVIAKAHPEDSAKTLALLSDNPLPADARGK